jgi:hypothetical protein
VTTEVKFCEHISSNFWQRYPGTDNKVIYIQDTIHCICWYKEYGCNGKWKIFHFISWNAWSDETVLCSLIVIVASAVMMTTSTLKRTWIEILRDRQWSIKHYRENKKLNNTNFTKNESEIMCFGRVSSSCLTSDTRHGTLIKNMVTSHERGSTRLRLWLPEVMVKNIPFYILKCLMWRNGALFFNSYSSECSNDDYFYSETNMERNPPFHKCCSRVIYRLLLWCGVINKYNEWYLPTIYSSRTR